MDEGFLNIVNSTVDLATRAAHINLRVVDCYRMRCTSYSTERKSIVLMGFKECGR